MSNHVPPWVTAVHQTRRDQQKKAIAIGTTCGALAVVASAPSLGHGARWRLECTSCREPRYMIGALIRNALKTGRPLVCQKCGAR